MWKQTIAVQQHFNDISWRIRGLALTALTATLGLAAVAARDKSAIELFTWNIQLSSSILLLGLILWLSFYFVDQVWYHRLLIGAVKHGEALETALREHLPEAGLTHSVSLNSPYPVTFGVGRLRTPAMEIHSSAKMRIFYFVGGATLLSLSIVLQIGA
ncbi:hypothetical protein [Streptomyces sp. Midd1]|uniref:hypothetical protein n=1 Tax=Streptomyces sp. Midd3 TaxID=3161191 RepID=UPI0034DADA5C